MSRLPSHCWREVHFGHGVPDWNLGCQPPYKTLPGTSPSMRGPVSDPYSSYGEANLATSVQDSSQKTLTQREAFSLCLLGHQSGFSSARQAWPQRAHSYRWPSYSMGTGVPRHSPPPDTSVAHPHGPRGSSPASSGSSTLFASERPRSTLDREILPGFDARFLYLLWAERSAASAASAVPPRASGPSCALPRLPAGSAASAVPVGLPARLQLLRLVPAMGTGVAQPTTWYLCGTSTWPSRLFTRLFGLFNAACQQAAPLYAGPRDTARLCHAVSLPSMG